jgi:flagellar basal-body rod protein FlgG
MISGIYIATAGANVQTVQNDVIANNLANLESSGFKRQTAIFRQRDPESVEKGIPPARLDAHLMGFGGSVALSQVHTDFSEGTIMQTEKPLDLAIEGRGFFCVRDPETREEFFTRAGHFSLDAQNYMVTANGRCRLLDGNGVEVRLEGNRTLADFNVGIHAFKNPQELDHVGDSLYRDNGSAGHVTALYPDGVKIGKYKTGYLEKSNVNPVRELVNMIEAFRAYEANMRVIRNHDSTLARAVNDVGRVR